MSHGIKQQPWEENFPKTGGTTSVKLKAKKTLMKAEKPANSGTRRIFSPQFKLQVLDSYRQDADCQGNQRATARKYGIHRRQIQKWLQMESSLRCTVKANMMAIPEPSSAARQSGASLPSEGETNMAADSHSCEDLSKEEEYVNVDEITDSEDCEEALDLSIKLKLSNRDLNVYSSPSDDLASKFSPPLWYPLPPCCYPYSWNYLPSLPSPPSSANIYVEKPQPRRQHLPLDFTNYTYDRPESFHLYRIHSY